MGTAHIKQGINKSAFTLVELLAVIVIVSLVAGVATIGLAANTESARLHATAAEWRDLDGRARLFSRSLGPVVMSIDQERGEVELRAVGSNELLSKLMLPSDLFGSVQSHVGTDPIVFDRLGRSVDYEVQLHGAHRVMSWRVHGLTGLIEEQEP